MIIAIDFDGVIVEDCYPDIGEPLPYMKDVMQSLLERGHILIINTCRVGQYAIDAQQTLLKMEVLWHCFNRNHPMQLQNYSNDCRKISADLYLDDKNLGGFPGWLTVLEYVEEQDNDSET